MEISFVPSFSPEGGHAGLKGEMEPKGDTAWHKAEAKMNGYLFWRGLLGSQEKSKASDPGDKSENNRSLGFAGQIQKASSEGGMKSSHSWN